MTVQEIELLIGNFKFQILEKCEQLGPRKFAMEAKIKESYASRIKSGSRPLPTDTILRFAKLFNMEAKNG